MLHFHKDVILISHKFKSVSIVYRPEDFLITFKWNTKCNYIFNEMNLKSLIFTT